MIFATLFEFYHISKEYLNSRKSVEVENSTSSRNDFEIAEITNILSSKPTKTSYLSRDKSTFHRILISFSIYNNSVKLFKINRGPNPLRCLHAIRVITISWYFLYGFKRLNTIDLNLPSILKGHSWS